MLPKMHQIHTPPDTLPALNKNGAAIVSIVSPQAI